MAELRDGVGPGSATRSLDGDGRPVIHVAGEFDVSNVHHLAAVLDEVEDAPPPGLVLEAHDLQFIDSSGIAVLIRGVDRLGPIEVRDPSPVFRRIVEITGLTDLLRIDP